MWFNIYHIKLCYRKWNEVDCDSTRQKEEILHYKYKSIKMHTLSFTLICLSLHITSTSKTKIVPVFIFSVFSGIILIFSQEKDWSFSDNSSKWRARIAPSQKDRKETHSFLMSKPQDNCDSIVDFEYLTVLTVSSSTKVKLLN